MNTTEQSQTSKPSPSSDRPDNTRGAQAQGAIDVDAIDLDLEGLGTNSYYSGQAPSILSSDLQFDGSVPDPVRGGGAGNPSENVPMEMIGLGLEEPMPTPEVINDL